MSSQKIFLQSVSLCNFQLLIVARFAHAPAELCNALVLSYEFHSYSLCYFCKRAEEKGVRGVKNLRLMAKGADE